MLIIRRFFHKIPFLPQIYHWLWAAGGALVYRFPSRHLLVVGVTGTKGKTTVVELLSFILRKAGCQTAALSSLNSTANTMPGRFFIQRFLRQAVNRGCRYAVIEVTSEGVKLGRHRFIRWGGAIFLNIHPEHIESHGSFAKYRQAKLSFFRYAARGAVNFSSCLFFINKDDAGAEWFIRAAGGREKVVFFGKSDLSIGLTGEFNRYNVGAAAAAAKRLGVSSGVIKRAVAEFPGVPGRMEFIQRKPFAVVIDYAHTPDSLEAVYRALKQAHPAAKLIGVFGSAGGGRDKWKRPEMGKIAAKYCNRIILTDEDPYDEDPKEIIEEIAAGASHLRNDARSSLRAEGEAISPSSAIAKAKPEAISIYKILNRKEAIKRAIDLAKFGDVVVITGKGSEKFIHIAGGKKNPWSDRQIILDILNGRLYA